MTDQNTVPGESLEDEGASCNDQLLDRLIRERLNI